MSRTQEFSSGSTAALPAREKPKVFTSIGALAELQLAWSDLASGAAPMQQTAWTEAAAGSLCRPEDLRIVAVYQDGHVVGIAPLESRRINGVPQLASITVHRLYEPVDCPCRDDEGAARLAESLLRLGRPVLLSRIPTDSRLLAALRKLQSRRRRLIERPQPSCPYITLDASWLEPESHFNSGRRSDFRRSRKRAEQFGPIKTRIIAPTADELPDLLDEAMRIEATSWKGDAGTALAHDESRAEFFRQYAKIACEQGILRLCFLDLGDRTVAMQIAVQTAGALWLLKIGYDPAFSSGSPGMLLMRETIRYSVEQGLARYEFLGKSEAWTDVWTKEQHECLSVQIYPFRPRGMLALGLNGAASLTRAWKRRVRSDN
jgi:CelD/BcsL family acetyltransferase involved in cellulose biosynthesis